MKLLVLSSRYPLPLEKGDRLRIYHQMRYLSKHFELVLVALTHREVSAEDRREVEALCEKTYEIPVSHGRCLRQALSGFLRGTPVTVAYFFHQALKAKVQKIIAEENPDHVYCQLIRMAGYAEGVAVPKSIDYMDSFSLRASRRARQNRFALKWFWDLEARLLQQYERQTYRWFDHHFVISQVDQEEFIGTGMHRLEIVRNGVDTRFFSPNSEVTPDVDLVFIGNMSYHPNVMAAKFLVKKIAPLLWKKHPDLRILIAGADPTREVKMLAEKRVEVSGFVPDIRTAYQRGKIFVAPIFAGSGLQNKILEALSMGVPCITSAIVQQSISGSDGIVLVAEDEQSFVNRISTLLGDDTERAVLAKKGREVVENNYAWASACKPLLAMATQKDGQILFSDS